MVGRTARLSDEVFASAVARAIDDALTRRGLNTVLLLVGDLIRSGSATPDERRRYLMAWQALQLHHAPCAAYRFAEPVLVPPEPVA